MPIKTTVSLADILSTLRVPRQGILYVQSSIDWLQRIGLGVFEVLNTLQNWATPEGTLIMPSYPYYGTHLAYLQQNPVFDVVKTPVKIGLIPEIFRRFPNVRRSLDPDHPITAQGEDATTILGQKHHEEDSFGPNSTYRCILDMDATLIGLGVSLNANSFIHVIDSQLQHQYAFPVYHKETFEVKVKDYNAHTLTVRRKSLRPEFQTKIEPSAIAKEIGTSTILIFNVNKSLLLTPYCLNFIFNHFFSPSELLLLFKITKSFFLSNLI